MKMKRKISRIILVMVEDIVKKKNKDITNVVDA